uniref:Alpha-ketoglutarate-dependent dioxygenase AlkB-like domain-containing protein n=1 Tax=Arcella intermedia TaxID=1963864 RepID=A0A6B2LIS5_9EUKA
MFLIYNFLSEQEETDLLAAIQDLKWDSNRAGTRRVQLYVPWHEHPKYVITPKTSSPPLPPKAVEMAKRIIEVGRGYFPKIDWDKYNIDQRLFCELQINEYGQNDALGFHKDNPIAYYDVIFGVSLLSHCWIHYQYLSQEVKVLIPRRSLYLLSGKARYQWKHGIPPQSLVDGDKRISLTMRRVNYTKNPSKQ